MSLLLDSNMKSNNGTPVAPLDLTLGDLEGQRQGHLDFEGFFSERSPVRPYVTIKD